MDIKNIKTQMKNVMRIAMLFGAITFLGSCSTDSSSEGGEHGEEHEEHEEGPLNKVSITQAQAKVLGLKTNVLMQKSLGNNIKVNGFLDLYPQDEANVNAFIGGNVSGIYFVEGDKIRKGQVLARLEHPDYLQMQQELQQSVNELDYLKTEYERKEKLYKEEGEAGRQIGEALGKTVPGA